MSRRSDVVRSELQSESVAVKRSWPFTWNASLASVVTATDFAPGDTHIIDVEQPAHTSLGTDVDFDESAYPDVRIVTPRDAIYSVSARVRVWITDGGDVGGMFHITIKSDGEYGADIDHGLGVLMRSDTGSGSAEGLLLASHAGFPIAADSRVWVEGYNHSLREVTAQVVSLSVTYEAELGTVYAKWGPT